LLANLEDDFAQFGSDRTRVGLLRAVLSQFSGLTDFGSVAGLVAKTPQMPDGSGIAEAGTVVAEVAGHLDAGDLYTGVAMPARTALSLYDAHVEWAPGINDLEDEHGLDAITRLVGLGLVAEGLSDLDSDGAAQEWTETESGRATLMFFAAVEVAIAFGTEDEPVDGDRVLQMLDSFFDDAIDAWADLASERALARARIIVNNWTDIICPAVNTAQGHLVQLADVIRSALGTDGVGDGDALIEETQQVGLYRSLVARHVGERLHGALVAEEQPVRVEPADVLEDDDSEEKDEKPLESESEPVVNPRMDSEDQVVDDLRLSELNIALSEARVQWETQRASLEVVQAKYQSTESGVGVLESRIQELTELRSEARKRIESLKADRRQLQKAGNEGQSALADQSTDLAAVKEAHTRAENSLSQAQRRLEEVQGGIEKRNQSRDDAHAAHRAGLVAQQDAWGRVRMAHQSRLTLLTAGADLERLQAIDGQIDTLRSKKSPLKTRLSELRKARRSVSRDQQSAEVSRSTAADRLVRLQEDIEAEAQNKEQKRDALKVLKKQLSTLETKLNKRRHRVGELEDRQAGTDELVLGLSDQITQTRSALDTVTDQLNAGHKERDEQRRERRKAIRKRLVVLGDAREQYQRELSPVSDANATNTTQLGEHSEAYDALKATFESKRTALKALQATHRKALKAKDDGIKLTAAAVDMMRKNAGRLEEAHDVLREAQAQSDARVKEQNLRWGRLEKLGADIGRSERSESEWESQIEQLKETVNQAKSALERHGGKIERAQEKARRLAADRAAAVRNEIESKRARIEGLRGQIADAIEDREGLAVAEVRVDTSRAQNRELRGTLSAQLGELKSDRKKAVLAVKSVRKTVDGREGQFMSIGADIEGLNLTIRGLIADKRARDKRLAKTKERLPHLKTVVVREREVEADAVEAVADFQNWVDRTTAALSRLNQPKKAIDPPPPPKISKVDSLLAQLSSASEGHVPDPSAVLEIDSAATVVLERSELSQTPSSDEDATQILQRSTEEEPDDATEIYSPEDLLKRLQSEAEEQDDATVMMPRTQRRPPRNRDED